LHASICCHHRLSQIEKTDIDRTEKKVRLDKQVINKAIYLAMGVNLEGHKELLPMDDSARKVIYLAIMEVSRKWDMPIRYRKAALNRFMIEFEDRLTEYV
jgi:transposase-like protein